MPSFALLGPGAVGTFLAGALNSHGSPLTVVATEAQSSWIRTHGLHVASKTIGPVNTRPRAVAALEEPVDVLFITTRATDLGAAVNRIQAPIRVIVPLLSGLEHVAFLRTRFADAQVCSASIRIDVEAKGIGSVSHNSTYAVIDSAFDDGWLNHRELRPLVEPLAAASVAMLVSPSETQVMWSKLVFVNAMSLTSALTNMPVGWIRKDEQWRAALHATLTEGSAVARAEGANVSVDMTMDYVDHAPYQLGSLMQRDLQAGMTPELDAIAGAVLRAGRRHSVQCPTIRDLAYRVAERAGIPPVA